MYQISRKRVNLSVEKKLRITRKNKEHKKILCSIIGFTPSILKNVSRTLNSPDDASQRVRAFFIFILLILYKLYKIIN